MKRIHVYLDDSEVDDSLRLMHEGEPFTGELVNTYGETVTFLETYRNGWADGPRREWYHDGTLKAEGMARHSVAVGTHRKWHNNGTLAVEKVFTDKGRLTSEKHWDENGAPEAFRSAGMPE